ncbi:MAG TPA: sugar ABC transporter ATP-binding protein [Candidatus Limnocylindria bacterium]|nr:sugar ABC transporter ATP-binding protein [Candidatus Limnocylindria bacterium]
MTTEQVVQPANGLLLEATGIAKRYGAVHALRDASLSVLPGEVHALMGANGAGKSTLVKILTGAVHPDAGVIRVRGEVREVHSPAEARRTGLVSVYQEPAMVPDLTVGDNLRLTGTPLEPFLEMVAELGIGKLDLRRYARELPLAVLRVLDLARALAIKPDVVLLDEMTAALPADLTEKVLEVVGRQRESGRSVIFISHRLLEIAALCDRATVLRDGETVGVVDVTAGAEQRIVELMLGPVEGEGDSATERPRTAPAGGAREDEAPARLSVRKLAAGTHLHDVSFELHAGEVLGLAALEGQGQDELFDVLSGAARPTSGEVRVDGKSARFSHPADAIRRGIVLVPADRALGLLAQRSVRENIALPASAPPRRWGPIDMSGEQQRVQLAIERLQIDTRAQSEVQRLSGGNQQKVTIARWIAGGVRTLLCFDPTRGIDIRTKRQIYQLLRDLAEGGAAVLLYTSELDEIQRVCNRTVVIYRGRVVEEMPAAEADEPTLLRAAYGMPRGSQLPKQLAAEAAARAEVAT